MKYIKTCRYDIVFKNIMMNEKILKAVINSVEETNGKIVFQNLKQYQETLKTRKKVVDLLVRDEEKMINVEVNSNSSKYVMERNLGYICKIFSDAIKSGKKVKPMIVVQINLNFGSSKEIIEKNLIRNEVGKVRTESLVIYDVNMDKLKEEYYNEDKEVIEKYKYLIMLDLDKKELKEFMRGDEIVRMYENEVVMINETPAFAPLFTAEEDQKRREQYAHAEGIEQGQINVIKTLLKNGMSSKDLEKYIGTDINEFLEVTE